jgi:heavy metal sensor kinase
VKLATRISLFFLGILAVVLLGMSISIYALVRSHLLHSVDARCDAASDTIQASIEFDANGLEWESNIRHLEFVSAPGDGPLRWSIFQIDGTRIDGSQELAPDLEPGVKLLHHEQTAEMLWHGDNWYVLRRIVRLAAVSQTEPSETASPGEKAAAEKSPSDNATRLYPALVIEVATPLGPALSSLRGLIFALGGVSATIWILAAILGRYLCLKELAPLERMAHAARQISAKDFDRRVPSPGTKNELDDLANAFNDLLDRLQTSFEQQRRFAAEASHQLRTPLTAVLGQLEVALRRDRSPTEYREALASAHQQASVLRQIVETLLFFSRESDDATQIAFEHFELHEWLKNHFDLWRGHPRFEDMNLESSTTTILYVAAQPVLLAQALDNLLDNACKYSEPNTPINVRISLQESEARIEVDDQGCGISESERPYVFDPFFRGDQSRYQGKSGVGLGLSVAKRIAVFFGGRVELHSTSGRGTQISLILPTIAQPARRPEKVGA